jgi:hypothetical protein
MNELETVFSKQIGQRRQRKVVHMGQVEGAEEVAMVNVVTYILYARHLDV